MSKYKNCLPYALLLGWLAIGLTPFQITYGASNAPAAQAGTSTLIGTVTNTATSRTLEGARVVLVGTGRETSTDITGTYRFSNLAPGTVTISVSYTGLKTAEMPVTVAGESSRQDVGLTSDIYTLSKFVVSSEREGNAQAITLQRLSTGVKSIVSADAFGGLAGNPADLAVRLPGVEGEAVGGDFRYIRIRGMSQNLSTISQDGNRIADAASAGSSREFQFQTVGSDSVERIEVVKSPTPDMDGDSIGGNVNLVSKSAFDSSGERRIGLSAGTIWRAFDPRKDRPVPSYSFSYSEVFAKKIAVSVNLGYRIHEVLYSANGFGREQLASGLTGPAYTYSVGPSDQTFSRTREGGGIKLDYKLNDNIRFYVNGTFNKHLEHGLFDGNTYAATWQTNQVVATRDATGALTGTGGIVPGYTDQVTDVRPVAASSLTLASTEAYKEGQTQTVSFGGKHRYSSLEIDYDLYQSKSKSNYANNATMNWSMRGIGFRISRTDTDNPTITQTGGPDYRNLNNYDQNVYTKSRSAGWDQYEGASLNVKKQIQTVVPTYIKMGLRLRDQNRELRNTTRRYSYVGPDGVMGINPATGLNDDNLAQFGVAYAKWPNDRALGGYPTDLPFPVKPNEGQDNLRVEKILAQRPQDFRQQIANDVSGELAGNQSFEEKINGYYMMGSVDLGKLTITGGVRVETTKTDGEGALQIITPEEKARRAAWVGVVTDAEQFRRTTEEYGRRQKAKGDYRTVFPGLHFKFEPLPRLVTRLSYATNIGRPAIGQLIPRTTANIDSLTVSTSNPSLKPQYANNFDATAEYYFEPSGVVSVGVFLKEMKNFIYTLGGQIVAAGVDNGFGGEYAGYTLTSQRNGGSAKVKGIELSYSQQFTFLPGFWSGLGAFANSTHMSAEGNYGNGNATTLAVVDKIAGFNPFVANLGVSYIKDRVSVRFQYNMRGRYLGTYSANESRQVYLKARDTLDIKTVYHFSKRFDVYLDVVNLFETPDRWTEFNGGRPNSIGHLTRQILMGVNSRF
ncbi:MAG: hypothetical protein RIQ93_2461 [Verrucomicrobiota bacterium]|jgi:TonB-dependent receptor